MVKIMQNRHFFILFTLLSLVSLLLLSCDKIEPPYFKDSNLVQTDVDFPDILKDTVTRKILIEEYSAQQCQNCPTQGAGPLAQLLEKYPKKIEVVCMHAGALARPNPIPPFDYDFRTDFGTKLYQQYVLAEGGGIPCAVVNRTRYQGMYPLGNVDWEAAVLSIDTQVYASIQLIAKFENNLLVAHTKTSFYQSIANPVVLSLLLIEDDIISPQMDGATIIENYVHNHVLRASLNGDGTYLNSSGIIEKDSSYLQSHQVSFAEHDWNINNCSLVAFIFDESTGEVFQVNRIKAK